jgi:DNA-binding Lrp family transcriptional regulator
MVGGGCGHYDAGNQASEEVRVSVRAYVLIQTEVGKAASVASKVGEIPGVVLAEDVTGPYDVIVQAEAESVDDLGKMVVSRVQLIEGITRTLTCPVVRL